MIVDIAIIGASFAGLTCALAAAERGASVAVLDDKKEPGARIRTTGIFVKEAYDTLCLPKSMIRRVPDVRLYTPSLRIIDLSAPGSFFITTDTADVLRWMASRATREGAVMQPDFRFRGATRNRELWTLDGSDVQARYLIGADGARSAVARALNLGRNRQFLIGIEGEFDIEPPDPAGALHCFASTKLARGYIGWVAPGPEQVQVGLAIRAPEKPDFDAFLAHIRPVVDLKGRKPLSWRSGSIPVGGPLRPFAREGAMLIGDAAGIVSPLTAGGIHPALELGRLAGQAAADHLLEAGPDPAVILAQAMPKYRLKQGMRWGMDHLQSDFLTEALLGTKLGRSSARWIYYHHRAPKTVKDLGGMFLRAGVGQR